MEQRHGQVADVLRRDGEPLHQGHAREEHGHVSHLHSLRVAAGAGREDHHEGVQWLDLAMRDQRRRRGEQVAPLRGVDVEHPHPGQVQALEQRAVRGVDQQDLAVGVQDVAPQRRTAPGVVDAAQHVTAQTGRGHRGEHFRRVAQQRADVRGPSRVHRGQQRRGLRLGRVEVFPPAPLPVAVAHRGAGLGAAGPQQLLNGLERRRTLRHWSHRPIRECQ